MSNYTKSTNFATKDNLTPGDPLKVVRGTEIDTEFNNISTAIATKTDNSAAAITGGAIDGATVGATTPATGAFTTLAASGTTTLAGALVGAATQSAFNTVSTTLNLGGAATALNLGAATGTATVNNTTLAAKAITASTTLAVTGTSTLTGAVTATAGVSGPITSSSVSITGGSITGITDLAVADGGTGASTAAGGLNNLLPSQTGNASKYLQTDGTNASWDAVSLSTADITGTLGAANGGTGVSNNAAMTVTGSGNFAYTRTLTGTTNVTFPTTGTLATLAGTETLTNKTLTSPILTTPTLGVATGTSFQGIIGNVTPAAGSFTTLGASSTATLNTLSSSGATLTGGTINGMTVGATTATTGAFTTLSATGVTTLQAGTVSLPALTTTGDTNTGIWFPAADTIAFSEGGAEAMRITSAGNLGIGTSSPTAKLSIGGSDAPKLNLLVASGAERAFIDYTEATSLMRIDSDGDIAFRTNNTESVRILASGNVGIGTSSPGTKLTINAAGVNNTVTNAIAFESGNAAYSAKIQLARYSGSFDLGFAFRCVNNSGTEFEALRLDSSGNLGLGVTPSAYTAGKAIDISSNGGIFGDGVTFNWAMGITQNAYRLADGSFKYKATGQTAGGLEINGNTFRFLIAPSGTAGNAISFTQAMTLDSSGNLGIGTTSPTVRVDAVGTYRLQLRTNDSVPELRAITADGTAFKELGINGLDLRFNTSSTERARIDSSGNWLVGTTSYNDLIQGAGLGASGFVYSCATGGVAGGFNRLTSDGTLLNFRRQGTVVGSISVTTTATAYNTSSDQRLKDNIQDADSASSLIDSLQVRQFDWKSDNSHQRYGFIAQELVTVAPEAVHQPEDTEEMMAVDYSKLVPMLVKEIQSLRQRLSAANL